ncbi:MAG: tetratricopeptide repeat protein [Nitrospirota bacterium]|nr:tetratricopeptide repeat protein [Nitrospirota bacterium]
MRTILSILILLALTASTVHRNTAWNTLLSLWEDCAAKSPDKSRTHNNLGNCNLLLGRYFPAIEEYRRAVALDPANMEAYYNLATTLDIAGLSVEAIGPYSVFCREAPRNYAVQQQQACERLRGLIAGSGNAGTGK